MTNLIVLLVLLAIVGSAAIYVYRAKKRGQKCIGCPAANRCGAGGCGGTCAGCSGHCDTQEENEK